MSYAARWVRFWSVVVALGVGLSFVVWHAVPGLVSLAAATAFVALSLVMVASAPDPSPPRLVLRGWRHLAVLSLATGSGGLAVVTVAVVFWPAAVLLAGGAAASCPWTVRRVRSVIDR